MDTLTQVIESSEAGRGFWHWFISNESLIIGTWVLGIGTLLLVIFALLEVFRNFKKKTEAKKQISSMVKAYKVRDFDPSLVVGAYYTKGTKEYLKIDKDTEIAEALQSGHDILIGGRPGIGKSHTAIHHLQQFNNWLLLLPSKQAVQNLQKIHLKRRRYLLYFDDLNEYVEACNEGESIFDLVMHLKSQVRQLIVIATVRNVTPEFDSIQQNSKLLTRWKYFELSDWKQEQGEYLAQLANVDFSSQPWDGTPLSIKQPSDAMKLTYHEATYEEQNLIQAIKFAKSFGIKPISLQLLHLLCLSLFNIPEEACNAAIESISNKGFLKQRQDPILAYDPYLDIIENSSDQLVGYTKMREILIQHKLVDELMLVGTKFYAENDFDEAERIYRQCIDLKPEQENCYYRLGVVLWRKSNWVESAARFSDATARKPNWATAWYRLSAALGKQNKIEEAKQAFNRAKIIGESDNWETHWHRAESLRQSHQWESALEEINITINSVPEPSATMYSVKGTILQNLGKPYEAIEAQRKALSIDNNIAESHLGLGFALVDVKDYDGAERSFRQAICLNPELTDAHAYLSKILKNDRPKEAEIELRYAIEKRPGCAEYHSYLGQLLVSKNSKESEAEYKTAILLKPNYAEAYVGLGVALRFQKKIGEAINANCRAIEINDRIGSAFLGLGMCYHDQGKSTEAVIAFSQAVKLAPDLAVAHFYLSRALISLEKPDEALAEIKIALDQGYNAQQGNYLLARILTIKGDPAAAINALQIAVKYGLNLKLTKLSPTHFISVLQTNPDFKHLAIWKQ